jgi:cAMP phosphodiesterase
VKVQLLPSTFDDNRQASARQHLACFVLDDCVAIDAGSLAMSVNDTQRKGIRDIVLTHAHLDHIAGLPLFIDDLFATVTEPIRVHSTQAVIDVLERDVFNWSVYPRFSELSNEFGKIMEYRPFEPGSQFSVKHLTVREAAVNHKVPNSGFFVSDGSTTVAFTGDTAEMSVFWDVANATENILALMIECAFPNELADLAAISHHMTPEKLRNELMKFKHDESSIYIVNIKPMYRDAVVSQLAELEDPRIRLLEVGKVYEW